MKLKAYRATGTANQYTVVGASTSQTTAPGTTPTYPTRIPVKAGDIIGLGGGTGDCAAQTGNSSDQYEVRGGDAPPGETDTYSPSTNFRMDISAQLEPDADNDGFGDETQDQCPTDASTQGPCQADLSVTKAVDKATAKVGDSLVYTITAKNNSQNNTSNGVVIDDALPSNVSFVSATGATCSPGAPGHVRCPVGDLAKGATKAITITVKVTAHGTANNAASVSSSTGDPNSNNNSDSASTLVPNNPAVDLPSQRVTVGSNRIASVKFTCGSTTFQGCAGSLVDKTASKVLARLESAKKKKILKVGSTTYTVLPGKTVKVKFKVSKKAFKLLKQKHKLKTIATTTTHDGLGNVTVKKAKITLKYKKKKH